MPKNRLIYLPLGGAGEIGMNAYVYGFGVPGAERFILVDIGVGFPNMETSPGVDLILPDLDWLMARADRLEAIFITHAHEDHIGALGHLFRGLDAPVYCRPFVAHIGRRKCEVSGVDAACIHTVNNCEEVISAGPFKVRFLPVSHSIPQAAGVVIDTPLGRVFHTGDFKLDETPVLGDRFDENLWNEIAAPGVKALICDSTNVFSQHKGRSEASISLALEKCIAKAKGLVVATTFASNVARLKTLAAAGKASGRAICCLGLAMLRMIDAARQSSLALDFPPLISPEEAASLPRHKLMLIVTGSQGEMRAASAQLSRGPYRGMELKSGDLFVFSSKTIPGNERGVIRVINNLSERGVDVLGCDDDDIHVSGHANQPDLVRIHNLLKPEILIPMHGEHRHLRAHAKLAQESGAASLVATNGMMVDLTGAKPKIVEHIDYVRKYLDGTRIIGAMDGLVRDRLRMAREGVLVVNLIRDEKNPKIRDLWVQTMGLAADDAGLIDLIEGRVEASLRKADKNLFTNQEKLKKQLGRAAQAAAFSAIGKNPQVLISIGSFE